MFETIRIKIFASQPVAKVTGKKLEQLIQRDFGSNALEVKQKLQQVISDTHNGKNRITGAILKLSNKDFNAVNYMLTRVVPILEMLFQKQNIQSG